MSAKTPDPLEGSRYGRLTVTGAVEARGRYKYIPVICDCGKLKSVEKSNLVAGRTASCGCLLKEFASQVNRSHGMSSSPIYAIWNMMRQRCNLPSNPAYEYYGGRGVKVAEQWDTFEGFYADMGDPPFVGASLDRIDSDKGYCKDNCRWATTREQANNTRKSVRFQVFGQSMTLREAAEKYGLLKSTLSTRIYTYGMTVEDAVTVPVLTRSEAGSLAGSRGGARTYGRTDGKKLYEGNKT